MLQHQSVAEAAAFGAASASGVEEINIVIVVQAPVVERAFINWCAQRKIEVARVFIVDEIPKTPMGRSAATISRRGCSHDRPRRPATAIPAHPPAPASVNAGAAARRRLAAGTAKRLAADRRAAYRSIAVPRFPPVWSRHFCRKLRHAGDRLCRASVAQECASPRRSADFAAGAAGLALGALLIAPLADRFRRRPILLLSSVAFGLLTPATAFASGLFGLLALRLLTGFGLGGAMANAIGLTADTARRDARSRRRHHALRFGLGAATQARSPPGSSAWAAVVQCSPPGRRHAAARRRAGAVAARIAALPGATQQAGRGGAAGAGIRFDWSPPPRRCGKGLGSACCSGTAGRR